MEIEKDPLKMFNNPTEDVNHEMYQEGLLDGHILAFQDKAWYNQNKNNFCNSLRENYPELMPSYTKDVSDLPLNFLGFYPDEFIRFGYLKQIRLLINGKNRDFYIVEMPDDLQMYHSSRSLSLNHSEYPVRGYDERKSPARNKETVSNFCPATDYIGKTPEQISTGKTCTYVSYYATPYLTKDYIISHESFGAVQKKYAYGISGRNSRDNTDANINDRLKYIPDEQFTGTQAYAQIRKTYYIIVSLDDFLIDRPDVGYSNMKVFKQIMLDLSGTITQDMNITPPAFARFMDVLDSVLGTGTIQDNVNNISRDYTARGFESGFRNWLMKNANSFNIQERAGIKTGGRIRTIRDKLQRGIADLRQYRGFRWSTFEHDRPVMNMIGWLFGNYPGYELYPNGSTGSQLKVDGFISSSIMAFSKNSSLIIADLDEIDVVGSLKFLRPTGTFHPEIGLFYAPEVLYRNRDNKFDNEYSINYLGINQELRKYKTGNIINYDSKDKVNSSFHQGHLFEHSSWVSILAAYLIDADEFGPFLPKDITTRDVFLMAGYIHDIGKSGECSVNAVYKSLNVKDPQLSVCNFVKENNNIIGMKYYTIPEHPEKGYEFLKGYKPYKRFTLKGVDSEMNYEDNTKQLYLQNWEAMWQHLEVDSYSKRLIRIAVGAHWYFGDYIRRVSRTEINLKDAAKKYVRDVELFYNDEFFKLDKKAFISVCVFVMIISIADILGSNFDPNLTNQGLSTDDRVTIFNNLPNIPLTDLTYNDQKILVEKLINYAVTLNQKSPIKRSVLKNLEEYRGPLMKEVVGFIENGFEFDEGNCYSIVYNLVDSYPTVADIKRAYPSKFPKIITFDLDQTLFAVQFRQDRPSSYNIYPSTYEIMQEVQKLRSGNNPTYIAVTSRHYSPESLLDLLQSRTYNGRENPLYYKNFDYIVSRYTGPLSKIQRDVSGISNFFRYNGRPDKGFIMDILNDTVERISDDDMTFQDIDKVSKYGHFKKVKDRFEVDYNDIISFDDDPKYFDETGLGKAKDVYVAGVLRSSDVNDQGIRASLFKKAIAYYVFDKIR